MGKQAFDTMKNGYNRYQVDDYIQSQEQQTEDLRKELRTSIMLKGALEQELEQLQKKYKELYEDLSVKERAAYDMTRMALKEANLIIDTAQANGDVIVKEALMMAREILMDVARLGEEAQDMKGNMKDELYKITRALDEFEPPEVPDLDLLKRKL